MSGGRSSARRSSRAATTLRRRSRRRRSRGCVRPKSDRAVRTERIEASVTTVFEETDSIYGSAKITEELAERDELETACRNTVASAIKRLGLHSKVKKGFKPTTTQSDPSKRPAANTLDRCFEADGPDKEWVTDITYLKTAACWVYLAVMLDLFSCKVVGWSLGDSLETALVSDALHDAVKKRCPKRGVLLHHSDRGCQYPSDDYQQTLKTLEIEGSMSRTGDCYDNAVMERFFWSLKHEWTNWREYATLDDHNAVALDVEGKSATLKLSLSRFVLREPSNRSGGTAAAAEPSELATV